MQLSDLTRYAKEKYQIAAQHRWPEFPDVSVMAHPETGKWIAVLTRPRAGEPGGGYAEIKCGWEARSLLGKPYLSDSLRLPGRNWIRVTFGEETESEVVEAIFDRALGNRGATIVLAPAPAFSGTAYRDTPLPVSAPRAAAAGRAVFDAEMAAAPEQLRRMMRMPSRGDGSYQQQARLFWQQAKFMEDYEDDAPWDKDFQHYFTTYGDLNVAQLRGYFAWRTGIRKGEFRPIATSLAYLYVYELLCGIGAADAQDTLEKLRTFETCYIDSGVGDPKMRANIHRWGYEYGIIHGLPVETVREWENQAEAERDKALAVLKWPDKYEDAELFRAICLLGGSRAEKSVTYRRDPDRGVRLFSGLWRHMAERYRAEGKTFFTACFGRLASRRWQPLCNAVYWEENPPQEAQFRLNAVRSYELRDGIWWEKRYPSQHFNRPRLLAALREADRLFRRELKTGHYLQARPEEAWATPYAEAVLVAERQAAAEAAQPEIRIDYAKLDRIRSDATDTMNSLLTEEERQDEPLKEQAPPADSQMDSPPAAGLDPLHVRILRAILAGQPVQPLIESSRILPSVAADTINEALLDVVGDNVIETEGDRLMIVDDYRSDILNVLGEE